MATRANSGYDCEVMLQIVLCVFAFLFAGSMGKMDFPSINIGAIMALDTTSGKIARTAIELAAEDVNRNTTILNGRLLNIDIRDSTQDALAGASEALELLRKGCVSIIGPETSAVAEFVAELAVAARVPVVTFAVTDPYLSMHRYPFFIRMTPSDATQVRAIAELIDYYRWRNVVLVYYVEYDLPALHETLRDEGITVYKAPCLPCPISPQCEGLLSGQSNNPITQAGVEFKNEIQINCSC